MHKIDPIFLNLKLKKGILKNNFKEISPFYFLKIIPVISLSKKIDSFYRIRNVHADISLYLSTYHTFF